MSERYDIAIIGAGVVGAAIAFELSRYQLDVVLLEARPDPGDEASKGNSALMCTGADTPANTLERQLVRRGYERYRREAPLLGLPIRKVGSIVLAWDGEQTATLEKELAGATSDGFTSVEMLDARDIYRRWPNFGRGIVSGLWLPDEAIVDPFSTPYAYVRYAVANGVDFRPGSPVTRAERKGRRWLLGAPQGQIECRLVINAGGIRADHVDKLAGFHDFTVKPRRGQYIVLDKSARAIHDVIAMPAPTPETRGILISPTIFGNVLVGPTAEDVDDADDRSVTETGLAELRRAMEKMVPALAFEPVTTVFAGMRPATDKSSYQIIARAEVEWITVAGIRSTGLSAALGIAEHVAGLILPTMMRAEAKTSLQPISVPDLSETSQRPWQDKALVAETPAYGEIVCHCERISLGEIKAALAAPVPPRTLKCLKRRTRVMFGRCQGFYCGARVQNLFAATQEPPSSHG
ncbi:MAG: NAD(P)/FAD-dependent oxidoreductase [Parvibaculaceae bacterium]